jgi:hypothetical protein
MARRAQEAVAMTELANEKRPGIRFTRDFQFFDHSRSQMWRSYRVGDVVDDPGDIEWLTAIGAPVEEAIYRR